MIYCDFCGKSREEVVKIVLADNGSAICDKCIIACIEALIIDRKIEVKEAE